MKPHWLALLLLNHLAAHAREIPIQAPADFSQAVASAQPGDTLLLPEGEWRDVHLLFKTNGQPEAPITLKAQVSGKTIISGKSQLRIGGSHLIVEGLAFQNAQTSGEDLIEFRASSQSVSHHCRLTQCSITSTRDENPASSHWVNLYGTNHRVDHCELSGKTSEGTTLVVWLDTPNSGHHRIDHNYFGPRKPLGRNGGETIRIGNSQTSMQDAHCLVEQNLFERCDGELECISNKSCSNVYRQNTFLSVSGTLTLRHGNRCTVEDNLFFGQNSKNTGGIRIIGEDHLVQNNYLEGLTGKDSRSAICLMAGAPNPPLNSYFQVKRAQIRGNHLLNCTSPIFLGMNENAIGHLPPMDSLFSGNKISAPNRTIIHARTSIEGIRWEDNEFFGQSLGIEPIEGIIWKSNRWPSRQAIPRSEVGPSW